MCAQNQKSISDSSLASVRPIELVTENGFAILRLWEIERTVAPVNGNYPFLVRNPQSLEREIAVEVADDLSVQITLQTRGRILLHSSFWIYCAERHLATYLWENDDYPPGDMLKVRLLDPYDCDLALRWETT